MKQKWIGLMALMALLTGCGGTDVKEYANKPGPKFDIREYLNGDLEAWGAVINMDGSADPQFFIKMRGEWKGNKGTLHEEFFYVDGTTQTRVWHFEVQDDHHFTGTAADVIGVGKGRQYGNAVNMKYVLEVPYKGRKIHLNLDDWLYRIDEKNVINRTEMRKFGIKVGELVIAFRKI